MDTNVVGRKYHEHHAAEKEFPKITRIYVRDLTEATHGNASGLGVAEYCHQQVVDKMDREITYINCMTGNAPAGATIPIYYETDRKVLEASNAKTSKSSPRPPLWNSTAATISYPGNKLEDLYLATAEKNSHE